MKHIFLFLCLFFMSTFAMGQAQIFYETFESGGGTFTLNGVGPGTNTGTNEWIVDSNYFGGGIYPNTTNEDSTYGGTISYAPYGHYLHIYDVPSGYLNDNYNPANASDRFAYTTNDICTLGLTSVTLNFFYLCQGSATAYGQAYFSRNGGPWTAIGPQLNNRHKWQYASLTNPQLNDGQIRVGFRWQNNSGAGKDTSALGIDDVIMTAKYDSIHQPITGKMINITGTDTVCPGQFLELQYTMSDTMCDANWNLQMSDGTGSFNNITSIWAGVNGPGYGVTTLGYWFINLPSPLVTGNCYRFRMVRSSWPFIVIYDSVCLVVRNCPTSITTMQPAVTLDSNAVCAGSVIDVPFMSSGTFGNLNIYYAELSDSAGNFKTYDTLGQFISNQDYSFPPGSVSGKIPNNVPAGCHYYVRVVADTPSTIGGVWGPFCIQHCDINTNGDTSVQACVWSCFKGPAGYNVPIHYYVHRYDSNAHYAPNNKFEVQLLNQQYFTLVNNGALGIKVDTVSSTMVIHVPCADSLTNIYNIPPGVYYMRIIATHSKNMPDSTLGSLVHLTIGEPADSLALFVVYPNSVGPYCQGSDIDILATPYRYMVQPYNSTYTWWESIPSGLYQFPKYPYGELSLYLNGAGNFQIICQETNYGCVGPKEMLSDSIIVQGPPAVAITGPKIICVDDTGTYSVKFTQRSSYTWTIEGNAHSDTANNVIKVKFNAAGTVTIRLHASDSCFPDENDSIKVKVIARPVPAVTVNPANICSGETVTLVASGGTSYTWSNGKKIATIKVIATTADSSYTVGVANAGCTVDTTVKLKVYPIPDVKIAYCVGDTVIMNASGAQSYIWTPSAGLTINDSIAKGIFSSVQTFTVIGTSHNCKDTVYVFVNPSIKTNGINNATAVYAGQSVQLSVQGGEKWYWSPSSSLNNDSIQNPIATPLTTTVYTVIVKDSNGCILMDTVTVDVKVTCGIFVPNVFSPSDPSNRNNILYVRSECLVSVDFEVFDRWGNKVFETLDINKGWDGNYRGEAMNPDTFVYSVTGKTADGKTLSQTGNVTLVR